MPALCACDHIPEGSAKGVTLNGNAYIVLRRENQFFVYLNRCPHLGIPLEWQPDQFLDEDGELIKCSTHGALFVIETGDCVAGPCSGEALLAVPFEVKNGSVWL